MATDATFVTRLPMRSECNSHGDDNDNWDVYNPNLKNNNDGKQNNNYE